jgi:hypothetical protein
MLPTPYVIQRLRFVPGPLDRYRNATGTWDDPVDVTVHGWAPASADQVNGDKGRSAVVRDVDLFAPAGTVFAPRDRVVLNGVTYEVVGHPEDFTTGPFRWRGAGLRINLKRVEG